MPLRVPLEKNDRLVEGLKLPVLVDSRRELSDMVSIRVAVLILSSELAVREASDVML